MPSLLEALRAWHDDTISAPEIAFATTLFQRARAEFVAELLKSGSTTKVPEATLVPVGAPDSPNALRIRPDGAIEVGAELLVRIHRQLFRYTDWLVANYAWQIAPIAGDVPDIADLVEAEAFPREALRLYAAAALPGALSSDGYLRSTFENVMLGMAEVFFKGPAGATHVLPKPLLDVDRHMRRFDLAQTIERMVATRSGPLYCQLHDHLVMNCLQFQIAHETAHAALGHLGGAPDSIAAMREDEVAADAWALDAMARVERFDLRALFAIFGFYNRQREEPVPLDFRAHPLHPDRMLMLASAALRRTESRRLRRDIGAGMAMIRTELPPIPISLPPLDDGAARTEAALIPSYRSDMENDAMLRIELHLPPELQGPKTMFAGAGLLRQLWFLVRFSLRSMVHPAEKHLSGSLRVRMLPEQSELVLGRGFEAASEVLLPAFPEWWMRFPESVFAIDAVSLADVEPDLDEPAGPTVIAFEALEFTAFADLADVLALAPNASAETLLRAASAAADSARMPLATAIYMHVFGREPTTLEYGDVMRLLSGLQEAERYRDAASIAEAWHVASPALRPGLSLAIAIGAQASGDRVRAIEFSQLERLGIGAHGSYCDHAEGIYGEVLREADHPFARHVAAFHQHYFDHTQRTLPGRRRADLERALQSLRAAQAATDRDPVFLRQYAGETLVDLAKCGRDTIVAARQEFAQALQIEPRFAPAHLGLASVAEVEGNVALARACWIEAHRVNPFHHLVMEFRKRVEDMAVSRAPPEGDTIGTR